VRSYHRGSTHGVNRFAPGPGHLDWANQPDPFRTYEGAPVLALPLADEEVSPSWDALHRPGSASRLLDLASLGAFLELSLGLTAWKQYMGSRWALRANPSSGNLHPTEGYVLLTDAPGVPAGLYHYSSRDHVLERRLTPSPEASAELGRRLGEGGFLFGLSSVHWREAWKYGVRAFRYCQHDAGHALASARYAAGVVGWTARLLEAPGDDDVAAVLGLDRESDLSGVDALDREHPDALVLVAPPAGIDGRVRRVESAFDELLDLVRDGEWSGRPNALSAEHVDWPEIETVAEATHKPRTAVPRSRVEPREDEPGAQRSAGADRRPERESHEADHGPDPERGSDAAPGWDDPGSGRDVSEAGKGGTPVARERSMSAASACSAVRLVRQRRSAVAMDGRTRLSAPAFLAMMDRLLPRPGVPPWDALAFAPRVHPVLFVHRVDGLAPGLYVLERRAEVHDALRAALRPALRWERPAAVPAGLPLFLLEEGDARSFAQLASCHQEIASDGAFSLGMLAEFDVSLRDGPWVYRRLFWETGVLGHVLYLEAEAAGLRSTGIGCYFDDVVHEVLGLESEAFRDLYHFTVGGAVEDTRLTTLPAYPDDVRARTSVEAAREYGSRGRAGREDQQVRPYP